MRPISFLSSLIDKGRSLLGRPVTPTATDAVRHDRFDAAMFQELREDAPALDSLVRELNHRYDYTDDLVRDILMEFFQSDPQIREPHELDPSRLINRGVVADIAAAPDTAATRGMTKHDKYGAAMATIGVTSKIRDSLDRHKEAMAEAAEEAEQAVEAAQQAADALEQAVQDAEAADSEYEGEGPMTPAQAAAQAVLDAAGEAAAQAQAAAMQAAQAAQDTAANVQAAMATAVAEAVKEVGDELAEEAALFTSWGIGPGELQRMSFAERAALAARLRGDKLKKFREMIGRFRMMAAAQRSRKVQYGRDEVYSVEMSDRLPDVLGSEFAGLNNRHLRLDFLRRFSEGQLLSREYRGLEKVGQGAVIACVDNSGSMSGPREIWAKAFALALLDQARVGKRDFVGINFADRTRCQVYRFPAGKQDISLVIEFIEQFFKGGTDFMVPLTAATDILEAEYNDAQKARGDIVFITDDDANVTPEWMAKFQARKARLGFRVFGIAVDATEAGEVLNAISDTVRPVTDFGTPDSMASVMQVI